MSRDLGVLAAQLAPRAIAEMEQLVAISTPSGDVTGAEQAAQLCIAALPRDATVERLPCSTAGCAPDLLARIAGTGERRVVLLGHLDTVIPHAEHRPLERERGHEGR
jgi:glutamate carboxypeptidase